VEELKALKTRAAQSAKSATAATLSRKAETLGVWQIALDIFRDGLGDVQSKEVLQNVLDSVDSWLRLVQNSREMWRFAAALGNTPEGLEELGTAEDEIKQVKAAVEKMSAFLGRPRPPVDPSLLDRGRNEIAQGRYRTAEQIRAGRGPAEGGAG
jgi:hypothetical protein